MYPASGVDAAKIQGDAVSVKDPSANQTLKWDDYTKQWVPATGGSGGVSTWAEVEEFEDFPAGGFIPTTSAGEFATSAQGALADSAVQPGDLGGAAGLDVGTTTGTVAAGDDSRFSTVHCEIGIAMSDETTAITAGTAKVTFRMPWAMTVTAVRASLTTASSSGNPTVDINEGGTSILSTKLSIDATELTSTTAATAAVISDSALADDAEITLDVDTAGTGAKGLKVWIIGTRSI